MKTFAVLFILFALCSLIFTPVFADVPIGQMLPLKGGVGIGSVFQNPGQLFSIIYPNALVISGIILIFVFVFAGFRFLNNPGEKEQIARAQSMLSNAIIGLILIFAAYLVTKILEFAFGINVFNPPEI